MMAERLNLGRRTKEDEARYTFFCAAILGGDYAHTDISLETPYPLDEKKEIDALFEPVAGMDACIFEFKFDRAPPQGSSNTTERSGAVVHDLCRLALAGFPQITRRFFVYITDEVMDFYFMNPHNRLSELFSCEDLSQPFHLTDEFWHGRPSSFMAKVGKLQTNFSTNIVYASELPRNFKLKIFEVWQLANKES